MPLRGSGSTRLIRLGQGSNHLLSQLVDEVLVLGQIQQDACEKLRRRVNSNDTEGKLRVGNIIARRAVLRKGVIEPLGKSAKGLSAIYR